MVLRSSDGTWKYDLFTAAGLVKDLPPPMPAGTSFPVRGQSNALGATWLYFDANAVFPTPSYCRTYDFHSATLAVSGACLLPSLGIYTWNSAISLGPWIPWSSRPAATLFDSFHPPASAYSQPGFQVDVSAAVSAAFHAGAAVPGFMISCGDWPDSPDLPFEITLLELFVNYTVTDTCPSYGYTTK